MTNEMIVLFLTAQTLFIPIIGGLYMGIRAERLKQSRLYIISATRSRFGSGGFGK